jgi:hypothetical protein
MVEANDKKPDILYDNDQEIVPEPVRGPSCQQTEGQYRNTTDTDVRCPSGTSVERGKVRAWIKFLVYQIYNAHRNHVFVVHRIYEQRSPYVV